MENLKYILSTMLLEKVGVIDVIRVRLGRILPSFSGHDRAMFQATYLGSRSDTYTPLRCTYHSKQLDWVTHPIFSYHSLNFHIQTSSV